MFSIISWYLANNIVKHHFSCNQLATHNKFVQNPLKSIYIYMMSNMYERCVVIHIAKETNGNTLYRVEFTNYFIC